MVILKNTGHYTCVMSFEEQSCSYKVGGTRALSSAIVFSPGIIIYGIHIYFSRDGLVNKML